MNVQCRNCEKVQAASSNCRRCGRSLAWLPPVPAPQPPQPVTVVVEKIVEVSTVDVTHTLAEIERAVILARVEHMKGNLAAAARSLGVCEMTVQRKMKLYRRCNGQQKVASQ